MKMNLHFLKQFYSDLLLFVCVIFIVWQTSNYPPPKLQLEQKRHIYIAQLIIPSLKLSF